MATPESKVKVKVKALLKKWGCYQHWPVQQGYGAACLDCHGCFQGYYFAIECKAPGKHPTPRQEITMQDVNEAKGAVFVIGEYKRGDQLPDNSTITAFYSGLDELEVWFNLMQKYPIDQ